MLAWLSGKKTYIAAIATIVTAISAYANHTIDMGALITAISTAVLATFLRSGIANS